MTNYKSFYAEQLNALYSTRDNFRSLHVLAVPALLYGSECQTLTKQQLQQIKSSEMRFLR
jgi:hypothetical protein